MSVREFYKGKSVLVTGATGFVGRFLVYRLLATCDLLKVYVMIRSKRGVSPKDREEQFKKEEVFSHLPDASLLQKVHVVSGDLSEDGMGLSNQDRHELADNVSVVFHCAASIRLNQSLKEATTCNIFGTLNAINVAKTFPKMQSFIYMSSIANWFHKTCLEEKLYEDELPFFTDARLFVQQVNDMTEEEAESFSALHVGNWPKYPNNYSFTKTMCEVMLTREEYKFKIGIVRSPLLFSCLKVPEVGWVDKPQTGTALVSLYANGLIRSTRFDPSYEFNHIPLDMCINSLITTGWFMAERCQEKYDVININCTRSNPISIREVSVMASKLGREFPSMKQVRPPKSGLTEVPSPMAYKIHSFFTYTLFYHLLDMCLWLSGQKPVFAKMMGKALEGMSQIEKILRAKADVVADKLGLIYSHMSEAEKQIFFYDPKEIDWFSLLTAHHLRFRRVFLREDPANLEKARERMKRVTTIYRIVSLIPVLLLLFAVLVIIRLFSGTLTVN